MNNDNESQCTHTGVSSLRVNFFNDKDIIFADPWIADWM